VPKGKCYEAYIVPFVERLMDQFQEAKSSNMQVEWGVGEEKLLIG
jgi:hypothetical protein